MVLSVCRWPLEALANVESNSREKCNSPKDRRPNSERGAKEPSCDDGEQEARIDTKQKSGSASESEHANQTKRSSNFMVEQ